MNPTPESVETPALQFELVYTNALTHSVLTEAAAFFSTHYGRYSSNASTPGEPITISPSDLKSSFWPDPAETGRSWQDQCLIQAYLDPDSSPQAEQPTLVGQAFVTKWRFSSRPVLWITQLIVHSEYRSRGVARALVEAVKDEEPLLYQPGSNTLVGVNTCHPAALKAVVAGLTVPKSLKDALSDSSRETKEVDQIIQAGPLDKLKTAVARVGADADEGRGEISQERVKAIQTGFLVDNTKAQQLAANLASYGITLPHLPDGYEYVVVLDGV